MRFNLTSISERLVRIHLVGFVAILTFLVYTSQVSANSQTHLTWPAPPQQARITLVGEISSAEDAGITISKFKRFIIRLLGGDLGEGKLLRPTSIFVGNDGTMYVTDQAFRGVHIFNAKGNKYSSIKSGGSRQLRSPVDIVVGSNGNLYISDPELGAVFVYDSEYNFLFTIKGYFARPTGLAWKDNRLYVVDTALHKIFILDPNGVLLHEIGGRGAEAGKFNFPVYLTAGEQLYVNDALNFRVQLVDERSGASRAFGKQGDSQGTLNRTKGIGIDSDNNIYLCDALFNVFQIFSEEGQLLLVVGSPGTGPGEFQMPNGIYIDESDKIYVCDSLNGRIQIFQYHKVSD